MKLEREFDHLTISHKPGFRPFDHNEITVDSAGLQSTNGIMKDCQNRVSCDSRDKEEDAGQVTHMKSDVNSFGELRFDCSESVDDFECSNEYEVKDSVSQYTLTSEKLEALEKESDYYMDKSVMECELPEFIVCYKEGSCNTIKDICIDEGVPSQDKIWVEAGEDEKACYLSPDEYQKKQLPNEKIGIVIKHHMDSYPTTITEGCKSFAQYEDKDFSIPSNSQDLMQRGDIIDCASKKSAIDVSQDMFSPESALPMPQLGATNYHCKEESYEATASNVSEEMFSPENELSVQQLGAGKVHPNSSNDDDNDAIEEMDQISTEKGCESPSLVSETEESEKEALVSAAEESNCQKNDISDNSKVENGSISFASESSVPVSITSNSPQNGVHEHVETQNMPVVDVDDKDCDMSDFKIVPDQVQHGLLPMIAGRDECSETGVCQSPDSSDSKTVSSQVQNFPVTIAREEFPENGASQSLETSHKYMNEHKYMDEYSDTQNNPFLFHRGLGESSFSAGGNFASLLHTSGPYSGNVSLRSESSTASTRSFAFPVLQSEWNSSPVRMAKADRRHLRKHRGWRHSLLCCRF